MSKQSIGTYMLMTRYVDTDEQILVYYGGKNKKAFMCTGRGLGGPPSISKKFFIISLYLATGFSANTYVCTGPKGRVIFDLL